MFLLKPGQFANVHFENHEPGCQLQNLRFDFNPTQAIPGFSTFSVLGNAQFPTGFANTSAVQAYFDVEGYTFVPPPWTPTGWARMVTKVEHDESMTEFDYVWGSRVGEALWVIKVLL